MSMRKFDIIELNGGKDVCEALKLWPFQLISAHRGKKSPISFKDSSDIHVFL